MCTSATSLQCCHLCGKSARSIAAEGACITNAAPHACMLLKQRDTICTPLVLWAAAAAADLAIHHYNCDNGKQPDQCCARHAVQEGGTTHNPATTMLCTRQAGKPLSAVSLLRAINQCAPKHVAGGADAGNQRLQPCSIAGLLWASLCCLRVCFCPPESGKLDPTLERSRCIR